MHLPRIVIAGTQSVSMATEISLELDAHPDISRRAGRLDEKGWPA